MLGGNRLDRVGELIRHEVSVVMHREIDFPTGILVTVTRVTVSPDLEHAKVWVSVLPFDRSGEVFERLTTEIGQIQRILNRKLVLEEVPRIRFMKDEGEHRASHVEQLLDTME